MECRYLRRRKTMMRALLMSERGESLNGLFGACSHCEYEDVVNGLGIKGISRFCGKEFWLKEAYLAFSSKLDEYHCNRTS
jgi:hypothetical protein